MPQVIRTDDLSLPALAPYARLTQPQLRSRQHPEAGIFIAESEKVVAAALRAGCAPLSFLSEERRLPRTLSLAEGYDCPVFTAEHETLAQLTGYALTRGVLCAMRRPVPAEAAAVCTGARRLAVLEGIADDSNLGAIFRSAAALGVDGVLLSPTCCDPLSRRALRVSMGTVFQVPWARVGNAAAQWPCSGLTLLQRFGFQTAALALSDQAVSIDTPALRQAEKLALWLGTEGDGLSPETIARCDVTVVIPMRRGVDSLNVAAAAAVAFWTLCP